MPSDGESVLLAKRVADPMLPQPFRVSKVRKETPDTFTLELMPRDQRGPFWFSPGQFNMLYVFGVGEVPISICGTPGRKLMHTARAAGTVTRALKRLQRGDAIGVRGPFGSAWPLEESVGKDLVFIAGGIGLAPLRGALNYVLTHRRQYGRIVLLYGVRTPEDILFKQELERWQLMRELQLQVTADRATGAWRGHIGVVTVLIPRAPFDRLNCTAMICGPEVMMRYTVMELQKRGVPEQSIFLSMERNMKCAIGFCGHCQFGPEFICKDGPVFRFDRVKPWLGIWEL